MNSADAANPTFAFSQSPLSIPAEQVQNIAAPSVLRYNNYPITYAYSATQSRDVNFTRKLNATTNAYTAEQQLYLPSVNENDRTSYALFKMEDYNQCNKLEVNNYLPNEGQSLWVAPSSEQAMGGVAYCCPPSAPTTTTTDGHLQLGDQQQQQAGNELLYANRYFPETVAFNSSSGAAQHQPVDAGEREQQQNGNYGQNYFHKTPARPGALAKSACKSAQLQYHLHHHHHHHHHRHEGDQRSTTNESPPSKVDVAYACAQCGKSFAQKGSLKAHKRIHSGEKPFSCPICDRLFTQTSSLITHKRIHTGEKPYRCTYCSKAFSDNSTLTKHIRTHTGQRPYECRICMMKFSQSGNRRRHMKIHQAFNGQPAALRPGQFQQHKLN